MANPFSDLVPGGTAVRAKPVSSRNPFADLLPSSATFVEPDRIDPEVQKAARAALLGEPDPLTINVGGQQIPVTDTGPRVTVEPDRGPRLEQGRPPGILTKLFGGPPVRPLGPEEKPFRTLGKRALRTTTAGVAGMTFGAADAAARKVSGGRIDSLAGIVDDLTGFRPTEKDIAVGDIINFVGSIRTARGISTPVINKIAARSALKTMLNEGVTFGTAKAGRELADKFINNDPVDIEGIHFDAGLGVLFGAGEVGVRRLAQFMRGKALAEQTGQGIPGGATRAQTRARTEALRREAIRKEVRAAQAHFRETGDRTQWDAVREKYMGLDPKIKKPTVKPQAVKGFGKHPITRPGAPANPFADIVPATKPLITPPGPVELSVAPEGLKVEPVERIRAAAIKFPDGSIAEGAMHPVIEMELRDKGIRIPKKVDRGFVTSTGRYVDRKEAGEIAKKAKQLDADQPTVTFAQDFQGGGVGQQPTKITTKGDAPPSAKPDHELTFGEFKARYAGEQGIFEIVPGAGPMGLGQEVPIGSRMHYELVKGRAEIAALRREAPHATQKAKAPSTEAPAPIERVEPVEVDTGKTGGFVRDQPHAEDIVKRYQEWARSDTTEPFADADLVDEAYARQLKSVPSGKGDTNLFALPGKEKEVEALGKKMLSVKPIAKTKPGKPPTLTTPRYPGVAKTQKTLFSKLGKVKAKKASKYAVNGVLVDGKNLVATDGRQLTILEGKWGPDGLYDDATAFKAGKLKALPGDKLNFPRYKDLIPETSVHDMTEVNTRTLWRQARQAGITANSEAYNSIAIIKNPDGSLGFGSANPDVGMSEINVQDGGKWLTSVDWKRLIKALEIHAARGDDKVAVFIPERVKKGPDKPVVIRSAGRKTPKTTNVIMPVYLEKRTIDLADSPVAKAENGDLLAYKDGTPLKRNKDGTITFYHKTTPEIAAKIEESGFDTSNTSERGFIYLSDQPDTMDKGAGSGSVSFKVNIKPENVSAIDQAFDDELHVIIHQDAINAAGFERQTGKVRLPAAAKGTPRPVTPQVSGKPFTPDPTQPAKGDPTTLADPATPQYHTPHGKPVTTKPGSRVPPDIITNEELEMREAQQGGQTSLDTDAEAIELGENEIDRGRLKVEMDQAGPPLPAQKIIAFARKAFSIPIRGPATHHKPGALGWYDTRARGIRLKDVRALTTAMHEVGHHLDWSAGRFSKKPASGAIAAELMALGKALYGSTKPPGGYKSEGWAEFAREYLTGEMAQEKAPNLYKWFKEEYLPGNPQVQKDLEKLKRMIGTYRMAGAEGRVAGMINRKPIKGTLNDRISRFSLWLEESWTNELASLRRALKTAGLEDLAPSQNPYELAVAFADKAGAKARQMVLSYTTDLAGNRTGPGLTEIMKPIDNVDAWTRYAVSKRALLIHGKGKNPGISKADATYIVDKYKSPAYDKAIKGVTEWNHRVLDYLVEAGALEEGSAKQMKALNPIYIPFFRAFEIGEIRGTSGAGRGFTRTGKAIKAMKGSGREIIEPFEGMLRQTERLISIAQKSMVSRALAKVADKPNMAGVIWKVPPPRQATQFSAEQIKKDIVNLAVERLGLDPYEIDYLAMKDHWDDILTIYTNAGNYWGKDNIVGIVIDGKKQWFELAPDIMRVMEGLDQYTLDPVANIIFGAPTRLVRLGATGLNPAFGLVRNFIRDAWTASATAKHAKGGPVSAVRGVVLDVAGADVAKRFKALGGEMSGQLMQDRRAAKNLRSEMLLDRTKLGKYIYKTVAHPVQAMRELFSITETGVRVGEFEAALKAGEKKFGAGTLDAAIYALNQGQDVTTNFTRHGRIAKVVNQVLPFHNASIQGPLKLLRTFRDRPKEFMGRAFAAITIPALGLWWAYRDEEWYESLATHERIGYMHFRTPGTNEITRLPVPFEVGHVFASLPVAVLDAQYRKDPSHLPEELIEMLDKANPFGSRWVVPSIATIGPAVNVAANKDYAGRPIVPSRLQYGLKEAQYTQYTREFMKEIGKQLKLSPIQIEYLINSYSGGIYRRLGQGWDIISGSQSLAKPADLPIVGTLFLREPYAPKRQINDFYNTRDELNSKANSKQITEREDRKRKLYNRRATMLNPQWERLRKAKTDDAKQRIYQRIKRILPKR